MEDGHLPPNKDVNGPIKPLKGKICAAIILELTSKYT